MDAEHAASHAAQWTQKNAPTEVARLGESPTRPPHGGEEEEKMGRVIPLRGLRLRVELQELGSERLQERKQGLGSERLQELRRGCR